MKMQSLITDNVTEILVKIIEFTEARQKVLTENINNIKDAGFVPRDLDVSEFSQLMNEAVSEYIVNRRLLLRDTENIKFGADASFSVKAVVDGNAKDLLEENRDMYLEFQVNKLQENSLNQQIAAELLRQKQEV